MRSVHALDTFLTGIRLGASMTDLSPDFIIYTQRTPFYTELRKALLDYLVIVPW